MFSKRSTTSKEMLYALEGEAVGQQLAMTDNNLEISILSLKLNLIFLS